MVMLVSLLAFVSRSHAQGISFLEDLIPDPTSLLPFGPEQFSCSGSDIVECEALNDILEADFVCDGSICTPECTSDDDCALLQSCDTSMGYCTSSIECSDDSDCPSELGAICNNDTGVCTDENLDPCTSSAGCASDYVCYENSLACVPACTSDSDCALIELYGATCASNGECQYECSTDDDCALSSFANTCDADTTGLCYHSCSTDDDCTDGLTNTCFDAGVTSSCIFSCVDDADCSELTGAVCRNNTAFSIPVDTCVLEVECEIDADCDDGITNTCFDTGFTSICISTCTDDSDCDFGLPIETQCLNDTLLDTGLRTCSVDIECETDADCDDGITNMCYETPIGKSCIFSCETDEDCAVTEFLLSASCVEDEVLDSGISTCVVSECASDDDCGEDGLTNECVHNVFLWGVEVPRSICVWTCASDDDCELFAGTECLETEELGAGVSTCQPAAVTCDGDSDCADSWECNSLPGADVIGGNVCFPACDNAADCAALGFDSAPCSTFSVPFAGSIKYCDVTVEADEPTVDPTDMPSVDPTMSPTEQDLSGTSEGVRGSVVMAGLCVLAVARWM